MMKRLQSQAGTTLVEILLALLITGIVSAAMFRVYINQHHAWMIQDSVIEMQQSARAAIDELTRQLRMSGYALPNGLYAFDAYDTNPDTIVIYYKTGLCDAPIEHAMPLPSAELRCDGHDVSCFFSGQTVYIYDPNLETGEFFVISLVQPSSAHIQHNTSPLSRCYPLGSQVMAIDQVKYYVDQSDTTNPKLMVKVGTLPAQVYAEHITDLQFTYTMKNGITVDQPVMKGEVRQIGIAVTSRTARPDLEFSDGNQYRFETYQSQVYLRNLGV